MRSTFNILFYINRHKIKKNGRCPIMGRITVDGKLTQFSVKEDIAPEIWSVRKGRSIGNEKSDKELNRKLEEYEQELKNRYNRLVAEDAYVTAEILKNTLLKSDGDTPMLLAEFRAHNAEYLESAGINKSKSSYRGYEHAYKSLSKFMTQKYTMEDIAFKDLQYSFIEDFEFFLRFNLRFSTNTVFNILMKLKRIVHIGINRGMICKNPFADFRCKQETTSRRWLSQTELDKILHTPMPNEKVEYIRLLFIFSTFTGISYADLYALTNESISTDKQGGTWIRIKRQKTGTPAIVPLIGIALNIYNKYRNTDAKDNGAKVFDVPYYTLVRLYLEEVRKVTKLEVLKFHMSRHSFATTVCLSNGIPIETLSRMMGHKNISTTQIYAKIIHQKVEEDMQALEKRLKGKYHFPQQVHLQKTGTI